EGRDVRVAGEGDELGGGDLGRCPPGGVVHLVRLAGADQTGHSPTGQVRRDWAFRAKRSPGGVERGWVVLSNRPGTRSGACSPSAEAETGSPRGAEEVRPFD